MKDVNLETITDTLSWYNIWQHSGYNHTHVKPKFLTRKPKVIYTDTSIEVGKACEDLSWIHCTSTPHRSETDGVAERAVARRMGSPRHAGNRRQRTREDPEPPCVQTPFSKEAHAGDGRAN